jgi:RNA polymerase sigma factor (sigma-70 family)
MHTLTMTLPDTSAPQPAELEEVAPVASRAAFSLLARQHHRALLAYAGALSANSAADLVQEALLVAYRRFGQFDASADFAAWVRGIIRNKWREQSRGLKEEPLTEEALDSISATHSTWDHAVASAKERNPLFTKLELCMEKLPPSLREAVDAFYYQARNSDEAAAQLGANAASIRKRLERARHALRDCLASTDEA